MSGFAALNLTARPLSGRALALFALAAMSAGLTVSAQTLTPGNLVVSRSVYTGNAGSVTVGQTLPPNCVANKANKVTCAPAAVNGTYPFVFNNEGPDASFGITSPLFLDQMTPGGNVINSIEVPNSLTTSGDQLITSFSSKSEDGLHLSTDGKLLSFMGYVAPANALDVSNSNTPGVIDPTDPVPGADYRAVGTVNAQGQFTFTKTNAYSGNNGRASIYVNTGGNNFFYTVGNAGNGGNPEPQQVVTGAGVQIIPALTVSESSQTPGAPMSVASFNVSQLAGVPASTDKVGKDDNFRGMTLFNNVLYVTKGSGSNGVNTVYFVDTTGTACPSTSATPGIGLPVAGAPLPTINLASTYNSTTGLANNMCILAGFPTEVNKLTNPVAFPFGLWFANATTLYVSDEGDGNGGRTTSPPIPIHGRSRICQYRWSAKVAVQLHDANLAACLHVDDRIEPGSAVHRRRRSTPPVTTAVLMVRACRGRLRLMVCAILSGRSRVTASRASTWLSGVFPRR